MCTSVLLLAPTVTMETALSVSRRMIIRIYWTLTLQKKEHISFLYYRHFDLNFNVTFISLCVFLSVFPEARDSRLPLWKDQLWADAGAVHHAQRHHLWPQRHRGASAGRNAQQMTIIWCLELEVFRSLVRTSSSERSIVCSKQYS